MDKITAFPGGLLAVYARHIMTAGSVVFYPNHYPLPAAGTMQTTTRAVLLSALLFPGAGQFYLKRYISAACLISLGLACLFFLFSRALEQAQQISSTILDSGLPLDANSIAELISHQLASEDLQQLNIASLGFLVCWTIGIVDAYRVGRRQSQDIKSQR